MTLIDERAQLARAALGVTPVDSSEAGTPVRELIQLSVLGEPLVDSLQETIGVRDSGDSFNMGTIGTGEIMLCPTT